MVKKYCRVLEARDTNTSTGSTWTINDVPDLWRAKVEAQIYADGYTIMVDGTVEKISEEE